MLVLVQAGFALGVGEGLIAARPPPPPPPSVQGGEGAECRQGMRTATSWGFR